MTVFSAIGDATIVLRGVDYIKPTLIIHVCNNKGAWGAGFVLALENKWPEAGQRYKKYIKEYGTDALGSVYFVEVEKDVWVGNMIAQTLEGKERELDYEALYKCLEQVEKFAYKNDLCIQCPQFGAGLAGADWIVVEAMLQSVFGKSDINVTWYEFNK